MSAPVIELKDVSVFYPGRQTYFKKNQLQQILYDIDLQVSKGEILAIVGESGSGKSTLGRSIVGLVNHMQGTFKYNGNSYDPSNMSDLRSQIQIIFQDSLSALNPRMRIGNAILEVINLHQQHADGETRFHELMQRVNLPENVKDKYPHELSGGQRQRACIARALAVQPRVLICDEIVSALDVSIQAKILNLLHSLVTKEELALIFTTHDLSVVNAFANRIMVLKNGHIIESGSVKDVFESPKNEYTQNLLRSIPNFA